jgi:hypothetical protein
MELPKLKSKVKVTYPNGWTGTCPVHGAGRAWTSSLTPPPLTCRWASEGALCGSVLSWSGCDPKVVTGYVIEIAQNHDGSADLVYLHPSKRGSLSRASDVLVWSRVMDVEEVE